MSATIFYQPVSGTRLSLGGPSGFLDLLERLGFNRGSCPIHDFDHAKLETAAAATENSEYRQALLELAEAAYKHGELRLWAEY
jgi:hypothetical protein